MFAKRADGRKDRASLSLADKLDGMDELHTSAKDFKSVRAISLGTAAPMRGPSPMDRSQD